MIIITKNIPHGYKRNRLLIVPWSTYSQARRKNVVIAWIDYKKTDDMNQDNRSPENVRDIRQSHKIYHGSHENWKVELTGGKTLAEVKIQKGIFQIDALSPLLYVIAMMPLSYILRKYTGGYEFAKLQEKINHLMYMDDIKPFEENEKDLETDKNKKNIQPEYRNGF